MVENQREDAILQQQATVKTHNRTHEQGHSFMPRKAVRRFSLIEEKEEPVLCSKLTSPRVDCLNWATCVRLFSTTKDEIERGPRKLAQEEKRGK